MKPTRLIFVRHGETELNRTGRLRGLVDAPLNTTGHAQARAVARRLSGTVLHAIYSSPLARTMQTAAAIVDGRRLTVRPQEELRDIDYGLWAGRAPEEIERTGPGSFRRWRTRPQSVAIPEGESLPAVQRRVRRVVRTLVSHHPGRTIALVSHDVIGRVFLGLVLDVPLRRIWRIAQDNAALTVVDVDAAEFAVRLVNDTAHLVDVFAAPGHRR